MVYKILENGPVWGPKSLVERLEAGEHETTAGSRELLFYSDGVRYTPRGALFKNRTLTMHGSIDTGSCKSLMEEMLALDAIKKDKGKDIILYINSPGGYVTEGLMVYDTMQHLESDVSTVVVGQAMSMGSILMVAGAKGKRYALPNSSIMLHEVSAGTSGRHHSMHNRLDFFDKLYERLLDIYLKHMNRDAEGRISTFGGKPNMKTLDEMEPTPMSDDEVIEWLREWMEKDRFMTPEQAVQFGLIDQVLYSVKDLPNHEEE